MRVKEKRIEGEKDTKIMNLEERKKRNKGIGRKKKKLKLEVNKEVDVKKK